MTNKAQLTTNHGNGSIRVSSVELKQTMAEGAPADCLSMPLMRFVQISAPSNFRHQPKHRPFYLAPCRQSALRNTDGNHQQAPSSSWRVESDQMIGLTRGLTAGRLGPPVEF